METVLIIGATGNIGVAAIKAALRTKRNVLAIVRNQASADKLTRHVGSREGITTVEADITSDTAVQSVVDQVKSGKLPAFQHVYATAGTMNPTTPIHKLSTAGFRDVMNVAVEANFFAYRATIPYLIDQGKPSSWTLMTGAAGTSGWAGVTAISQGALFSLANVAIRENEKNNIRFNEVYLSCRVDYDSVAKEKGNVISSSEFAGNYEQILIRTDIKGCRVSVLKPEDVTNLRYEKKLA